MRKALFAVPILIFVLAQSSSAVSPASFSVIEKYFLEGKYNAVISETEELIGSGSGRKDELYYIKGLSELKANRFGAAKTSFNYIISNYSWSKKVFDARLGLGDSYFLEGDNTGALNVYNDIAGRYPSDKNISMVYSRLSLCYARTGARARADAYYNMVKEKAPLSFEARSAPAVAPSIQSSPARNAPSPIAGADRYSVQVGSFKNKRNADKLVKKLAARGYESYVEIPVFSGDKFYRVRVGKFSSKEATSKTASRLESEGYRVKVCTDSACE